MLKFRGRFTFPKVLYLMAAQMGHWKDQECEAGRLAHPEQDRGAKNPLTNRNGILGESILVHICDLLGVPYRKTPMLVHGRALGADLVVYDERIDAKLTTVTNTRFLVNVRNHHDSEGLLDWYAFVSILEKDGLEVDLWFVRYAEVRHWPTVPYDDPAYGFPIDQAYDEWRAYKAGRMACDAIQADAQRHIADIAIA